MPTSAGMLLQTMGKSLQKSVTPFMKSGKQGAGEGSVPEITWMAS